MTSIEIQAVYSAVRTAFASHPITWERITGRQQSEDAMAARRRAAQMLRRYGLTHAEIGLLLNRSRPWITAMLRPAWAKVGK